MKFLIYWQVLLVSTKQCAYILLNDFKNSH